MCRCTNLSYPWRSRAAAHIAPCSAASTTAWVPSPVRAEARAYGQGILPSPPQELNPCTPSEASLSSSSVCADAFLSSVTRCAQPSSQECPHPSRRPRWWGRIWSGAGPGLRGWPWGRRCGPSRGRWSLVSGRLSGGSFSFVFIRTSVHFIRSKSSPRRLCRAADEWMNWLNEWIDNWMNE